MYKTRPEIASAFRERGLRCTPQRYGVLDYLVRHPVHPTAQQIYRALNRSDPRASRATIYNNLRALTGAGLVREVSLEGKAARFDANIRRHHHFVCLQCGRLEDIDWFEFPNLSRRPAISSRIIRDYQLVIRGICGSCSESEKEKKRWEK